MAESCPEFGMSRRNPGAIERVCFCQPVTGCERTELNDVTAVAMLHPWAGTLHPKFDQRPATGLGVCCCRWGAPVARCARRAAPPRHWCNRWYNRWSRLTKWSRVYDIAQGGRAVVAASTSGFSRNAWRARS